MPGNCVELTALHQCHAEIARAIALADFINWNDARMVEARGGFRFQTKPLEMRFACPLAKADDFQCDCAVETFLSCPEHHALTAASNFLQQVVVAELS